MALGLPLAMAGSGHLLLGKGLWGFPGTLVPSYTWSLFPLIELPTSQSSLPKELAIHTPENHHQPHKWFHLKPRAPQADLSHGFHPAAV